MCKHRSKDPAYLLGRYAVIDIGTVTARLLVADVSAPGGELRVEPLRRGYTICNLGLGVDATGRLREESMDRTRDAVADFLLQRDACADAEHPEIPTVCVATSASRDAANAAEFRARLEALGVSPAIIPGKREAALSFAGASMDYAGRPVVVLDTGGGSTEIIAGRGGEEPALSRSFDVGCRRITERFLHGNPPTAEELDAARAWARDLFAPFVSRVKAAGFDGAPLVAVAGTATTVVSIRKEMTVYDAAAVHGTFVPADGLNDVLACLAGMTVEERQAVVGLDPRRADVIVGGLVILSLLTELFGADGYTASETDLLEGAVLALSAGKF